MVEREAIVFVVDDDPGALRSLRWLLESDGLRVETYLSAIEFLDQYDGERPGCLVLDVCMPDMDGLALQETLLDRGVCLPIIFVTGHGDVPASVRAMKRGAVDFLEKPVSGRELVRLVRQAIDQDMQRLALENRQQEIRSRFKLLTPREREVMSELLEGKPAKEIALELSIGLKTALRHRSRVLQKLEVQSEAELVRRLVDHSLELA